MAEEYSSTSKKTHDLHIEITSDFTGSLKIRPSSVSSSYIDDEEGSDVGQIYEKSRELSTSVGNLCQLSRDYAPVQEDEEVQSENDLEYVVIDFLSDEEDDAQKSSTSGSVLILCKYNSRHFRHETTVTSSLIIFLTKNRRSCGNDSVLRRTEWRSFCSFVMYLLRRQLRVVICRTRYWYYICPFSIVIELIQKRRRIQITEFEKEYETQICRAKGAQEESFRIYVDRNDSKLSLGAEEDEEEGEFCHSFVASEDGYQISFIDEKENRELRTLSLSADFTRSFELKTSSLLSVSCGNINGINSRGSSDFDEDDVFQRSTEYSIEFIDEKPVQKTKAKRRKPKEKQYKRLMTASISHEDVDFNINEPSFEGSGKKNAGFEIIFTNEDNPELKSKLSLSGDFSKSCEEILHYPKPIAVDIDIEDNCISKEDYIIVQNFQEQNGNASTFETSTPKRHDSKTDSGKTSKHGMQKSIMGAARQRKPNQSQQTDTDPTLNKSNNLEEIAQMFNNNSDENKESLTIFFLEEERIRKQSSGSLRSKFNNVFRSILTGSKKKAVNDDGSVINGFEEEKISVQPLVLNTISQNMKRDRIEKKQKEREHEPWREHKLPKEINTITTDVWIVPLEFPSKMPGMNISDEINMAVVESTDFNFEDLEEDETDKETSESTPEEDEDSLDKHDEEATFETASTEIVPRRVVYREKIVQSDDHDNDSLSELKGSEISPDYNIQNVEEEIIPQGGLVRTISGKVTGRFKRIFGSSKEEKAPEPEEISTEKDTLSIQPLSLEPVSIADNKDNVDDDTEAGRALPVVRVTVDVGDMEPEVVISDEIDVAVVESTDFNFEDLEEDETDKETSESTPEEDEDSLDKHDEEATFETASTEIVPRRVVYREKIVQSDEHDDDSLSELKGSEISPDYNIQNVEEEIIPQGGLVRTISGKVTGKFKRIFGSSKEEKAPEPEEISTEEDTLSIQPLSLEPVSIADNKDNVDDDTEAGRALPVVRVTVDVGDMEPEVVISDEIDVAVVEATDFNFEDLEEDETDKETSESTPEEDEDSLDKLDEEATFETASTEIVPRRVVYREKIVQSDEHDNDSLSELKGSEISPDYNIQNVEEEIIPQGGFVRTISGKVTGRFKRIFGSSKEEKAPEPEEISNEEDTLSIQPLSLEPVSIADNKDNVDDDTEAGRALPVVRVTVDVGDMEPEVVISDEIDVAVVEATDFNFEDLEEDETDKETSESTPEEDEDSLDKLDEEATFETASTEIVPRRVVYREKIVQSDEHDNDSLSELKGSEISPDYNIQNVEEEIIPQGGFVRTISGKVTGRFKRIFGSSKEEKAPEPEEISNEEDTLSIQPLSLEPVSIADNKDNVDDDTEAGRALPVVRVTVDVGDMEPEVVISDEIDVAVVEATDFNFEDLEEDETDKETSESTPEEDEGSLDKHDEEATFETASTEIVPKRVVYREKIVQSDEHDDDSLSELKGSEISPDYNIQNVEEEIIPQGGFVRTISGKVTGRFKRIFGSSKEEKAPEPEEISTEEDTLSIQPLSLEPVSIADNKDNVDDDTEAGRALPVVRVTVDVGDMEPEVVISDEIDVAVVESTDFNFEDLEEEETDKETSESTPEEDEDSLDKHDEEATFETASTEIIPRRVVYREKIVQSDEHDDDSLSELKGSEISPDYNIQNVEEEIIPQGGFVRTISGKVTGRFKRIFGSSKEEKAPEPEEISTEEDTLSIQPLSLEPVSIADNKDNVDDDTEAGRALPVVRVTVDVGDTEPEVVISDEIDVAVVEATDFNFEDLEEEETDKETSESTPEEDEDSLDKHDEEATFETASTEIIPRRVVYREKIVQSDEHDDDSLSELKGSEISPDYNIQNVEEEIIPQGGFVRTISGKVTGRFKRIFGSSKEEKAPEPEEISTEEDTLSIQPLSLEPVSIADNKDNVDDDTEAGRALPVVRVTVDVGDMEPEVVISDEIDVAVVEATDFNFEDLEEDETDKETSESTPEEDEDSLDKLDEEATFETASTEIVPKRVVYREKIVQSDEHDDDSLSELKGSEISPDYNIQNVEEEIIPQGGFVRTISGKVTGRFKRIFGSSKEEKAPEPEEISTEEDTLSIQPLSLEPVSIADNKDNVDDDTEAGRALPVVRVTVDVGDMEPEVVISDEIDVAVVEATDFNFEDLEEDETDKEIFESTPEEDEDSLDRHDEEATFETASTEIVPRRVVYREKIVQSDEHDDDSLSELKGSEISPDYNIQNVEEEIIPQGGFVRTISGKVTGRFKRIFGSSKEEKAPEPEEISTEKDTLSIQPLSLEPVSIADNKDNVDDDTEAGRALPVVRVTVDVGDMEPEVVISDEIDVAVVEATDFHFEDLEEDETDKETSESTPEEDEDSLDKHDEEATFETASTEIIPRRVIYREKIVQSDEHDDDSLSELKGSEISPDYNIQNVEEEIIPQGGFVRTISGKVTGRFKRIFGSSKEEKAPEPEEISNEEDTLSIQPLSLEPVSIADNKDNVDDDTEAGRALPVVRVTVDVGDMEPEVVISDEIDVAVVESTDFNFEDLEEDETDKETSESTPEEDEDSLDKHDEEATFETASTEIVPRRVVYREKIVQSDEHDNDSLSELKGSEISPDYNIQNVEEEIIPQGGLVRTISGKVTGKFKRIFGSSKEEKAPEPEEISTEEDTLSIQPLSLEPVSIADNKDNVDDDTEAGRALPVVRVTVDVGDMEPEVVISDEIDVAVVEATDFNFEDLEDHETDKETSESTPEEDEGSLDKHDEEATFETASTEIVPRRVVYREKIVQSDEHDNDSLSELKGSEISPDYNIQNVEEEIIPQGGFVRTISGKVTGRFKRIFGSSKEEKAPEPEEISTEEDTLSIQPLSLEPVSIADNKDNVDDDTEAGWALPVVRVTVDVGDMEPEVVISDEIDVAVVEATDFNFEDLEDHEPDKETSESTPEEDEGSLDKHDEEATFETVSTEIVPRRVVYREKIVQSDEHDNDSLSELKGSEISPDYNIQNVEEEIIPQGGFVRTISGKVTGRFKRIFGSSKEEKAPEPEEISTEEDTLSIQPLSLEPVSIADNKDNVDDDTEAGRALPVVRVTVDVGDMEPEVVISDEIDVAVVEATDFNFEDLEDHETDKETSESTPEEDEGSLDKHDEEATFETASTEIVPRRVVYREKIVQSDEHDDDSLSELKGSEISPDYNIQNVEEEIIPQGGLVRTISGKVTGRFKRIFGSSKEEKAPEPEEISTEEDTLSIQPLSLEPVSIADNKDNVDDDTEAGRALPVVRVTVDVGNMEPEVVISDEIDVAVVEATDFNFEDLEDHETDKETSESTPEEDEGSLDKHDEEATFETASTEIVPRRVVYREKIVQSDEHDNDSLSELKGSEISPDYNIQNVEEEIIPQGGFVRTISGKVTGRFKRIFGSSKEEKAPEPEEISTEEDTLSIQPLSLEPVSMADNKDNVDDDTEAGRALPVVRVTVDVGDMEPEVVISDEINMAVVEATDFNFEDLEEDETDKEISESTPEEDEDSLDKHDEEATFETASTEIVPRRVVYREKIVQSDEHDNDSLSELKGSEISPDYNIQNVEEEIIPQGGLVRTISGKVTGRFKRIFGSSKEEKAPEPEEISNEEDTLSIQPLSLEPVSIADNKDNVDDDTEAGRALPVVRVTVDVGDTEPEVVISDEIDVAVVEATDFNFEDLEEHETDKEISESTPEEDEGSLDKHDEEATFETASTEIVPRRVVYREKIVQSDEHDNDSLSELKGSEISPDYNIQNVEEEIIPQGGLVRTISGKVTGRFKRIFGSSKEEKAPEPEEISNEEDTLSIQPLSLEPVSIADNKDNVDDDTEAGRALPVVRVTVDVGDTEPEVVISDEIDVAVVESTDFNFEDLEEHETDKEISESTPEEDEGSLDKHDEEATFETVSTEIVPRRVVYREKIVQSDEHDNDSLSELKGSEISPDYNIQNVEEEIIPQGGLVRTISGKVTGRFKRIFGSSKEEKAPEPEEISNEEDTLSIQPLSLEPVSIADNKDNVDDDTEAGRALPVVRVTVDVGDMEPEVVISDEIDVAVVEATDFHFEDLEEDETDKETSESTPEEDEDSLDKLDEEATFETASTEIVPRRVVYREKIVQSDEHDNDSLSELKGSEISPDYNIQNVEEEIIPQGGLVRTISGKVTGRFKRIFGSSKEEKAPEPEEISTEEDTLSIQPLSLEPVSIADNKDNVDDDTEAGRALPVVRVTVDVGDMEPEVVISDEIDVAVVEATDFHFEDLEEDETDKETSESTPEEDEDSLDKLDEEATFETASTEIVPRRVVYREKIVQSDEHDNDSLSELKGSEISPDYNIQNVEEEIIPQGGLVRTISGKVTGRFKRIFGSSKEEKAPEPEEISTEEDTLSIQPLSLEPVSIADNKDNVDDDTEAGRALPVVRVTVDVGDMEPELVISDEIDVAVVEATDFNFEVLEEDETDKETSESTPEEDEDSLKNGEVIVYSFPTDHGLEAKSPDTPLTFVLQSSEIIEDLLVLVTAPDTCDLKTWSSDVDVKEEPMIESLVPIELFGITQLCEMPLFGEPSCVYNIPVDTVITDCHHVFKSEESCISGQAAEVPFKLNNDGKFIILNFLFNQLFLFPPRTFLYIYIYWACERLEVKDNWEYWNMVFAS